MLDHPTCSLEATPITPLPLPIPSTPEELSSQLLECSQPQSLTIKKEIDELKKKYETLTSDVLNAFKRGKLSVEDIMQHIRQLPDPLKQQCRKFILDQASSLSRASSIEEIFLILSFYWDFLNPGLLVHLTDRFDQAKTLVDKYMKDLRGFQKRTKLKDLINVLTSPARPNSDQIVMVLKDKWKERSLEDFEEFRDKMSLKQRLMMRFDGIIEGCRAAIFTTPKAVDLELENLHEFFQEHQILRVFLNGACIVNLQVPFVSCVK